MNPRLAASWQVGDPDGRFRPVHEAVARWAVATPNATAISCDGRTLSYRDLDESANRLARHLQARGLGHDDVAGIYLPRGLNHYVALLAIHKAGGAALPLDTSYPAERLRYMIADSGARILVTDDDVPALPAGTDEFVVVRPESDVGLIAQYPCTPPDVNVGSDDLAYVMYTSASTGPPKGVLLKHGGIANVCRWHVAALGLSSTDCGSLAAPLSFDASILDLWPLLTVGGRTVTVADDDRTDPGRLVRVLADNAVTVCFLTTALAELLLLQPGLERLPLRYLVAGGEALRRRPRAGLSFTLVNIYGPTETSVYVTSVEVTDEVAGSGPIPIGYPIGGIEIRLVDGDGTLVPDGEPGEIVVAGAGVGRGYHRRPELTEERFRPDAAGNLCYHTGDLAVRRPGGALEFLGRRDRQVKVRGHRIEPEEIERALLRHPAVRQTAVTVVRPTAGTAQIVAYVEADEQRVTADGHVATEPRAHDVPSGATAQTLARVRGLATDSLLEIGNGIPGLADGIRRHVRMGSLRELGSSVRIGFGATVIDCASHQSLSELLADITRAVEVTADDGTVVVAGIRSLPLLTASYTAAELAGARDEMSAGEFRWRVKARLLADTELAVDPSAFAALSAVGRVSAVEVVPRFKLTDVPCFDVLLRIGRQRPAIEPRWLDWSADQLDLATVRTLLLDQVEPVVAVRGIPNASVAPFLDAWELAATSASVGEIRGRVSRQARGVEPADLFALSQGLSYRTRVSWLAARPDGSMDAAWIRDPALANAVLAWPAATARADSLASSPSRPARYAELSDQLRQRMATQFVQHEMPDLIVVLDRLPLTPVGKVDRAALPLPAWLTATWASTSDGPRSETEQAVAALITELIGRGGIGVDEDVRALGAHSLTMAQLAARITGQFGVDIRVRSLLENPTVAAIARLVEDAIIADLRHPEVAPSLTGPAPRAVAEAPVSLAQQRLWFLHQMDPDSPAYNIPTAYRLRGGLDLGCLGRALSEIVRRHQVLRSAVDEDGTGTPILRVMPSLPLDVPVTEVGGESVEERLARTALLARAHVQRPFDLRAGLLLRAELFRVGPDDHVLVVCLHHIAADAWTLAVLASELTELYSAFMLGLPPSLAEPPLQYADYAAWQREQITPHRLDQEIAHWRKWLDGIEAVYLHPDRPRSATRRFEGARVRRRFPGPVAQKLRSVAAAHGATTFAVFGSAMLALLGRYTGRSDVSIGAAMADRGRAELESLVGFFVNTVVLRSELSADPSFIDLVAATRDAAFDAREHQHVPLERLVDALGPQRDLSRPPLISVVLSYLNTPVVRPRLPGIEVAEYFFDPGIVKFELDVVVLEDDGGLTVDVDYRSDLFDRRTIERMLENLECLLTSALDAPHRPVSTLSMLSSEDVNQLMTWGNAVDEPARTTETLAGLFAEQVMRAPERPALRYGDEVITYRQLDEMSGSMARRLTAFADHHPMCVGVCLPRSPELITALLAVVRAGGYYLPLDPGYPPERLRLMLADSAASVLITSEETAHLIDGWTGPVVLADAGQSGIAETPEESSTIATGPISADSLAYVMYTSGSTGRPKGVLIPQRAVIRLAHGNDYVRIGTSDRIAHASSVSFDAATFEIWGALLNGAELVILPQDVIVEPDRLARALREQAITIMWMTSSLFNHTIREVPDAVAGVGTVLAGGEALDPPTIRAVLAGGRPARLINGYGPTENTTFTTTHLISDLPPEATSVPIGRPIRGTYCYVLDDQLQLVPPGAPGELYAGGLGLAFGYARTPQLTAERFVPDPYREGGSRLYRTGDLVRWDNEGRLEFLRRRDGQVKIRGYRIEPGEIEEVLTGCPGVRSAVVLISGEASGPRLVAYIEADPRQRPTASDLQAAAEHALPGYMVPAGYVILDEFPLNANGKTDRDRLSTFAVTKADTRYEEPENEIETAVCQEWERLLDVGWVGATANFFRLGGDSLLATKAVSRLRQRLGVRVTVRALFDHPTAREFASAVTAMKESRR